MVRIGKSELVPGFEEQVVGMKPGETKEFDLTFPDTVRVPTETPRVTWTVRNTGDYSPAGTQSFWNDALFLSTDAVLDGNDLRVGTVPHTGGLAPLGEYLRDIPLTVPAGLGPETPLGGRPPDHRSRARRYENPCIR